MLGFYELDIDIDLDRLISEHEIIKEKYDYQNYYTNFDLQGNSNYAFPLILKNTSFKIRDK